MITSCMTGASNPNFRRAALPLPASSFLHRSSTFIICFFSRPFSCSLGCLLLQQQTVLNEQLIGQFLGLLSIRSGMSGHSVQQQGHLVWAAVFTFNPYLLISINELLISIIHLLISINELLISINELLISINELLISINTVSSTVFIDIYNSVIDINKGIIDINNSFIDINKYG